ncbi:MAG: hypothetical protein WCY11_21390, partial [Novosphingobium sp.]
MACLEAAWFVPVTLERGQPLNRSVRCAADGIRQRVGLAFPVANRENAYSLIRSISLADWSLYAWRP